MAPDMLNESIDVWGVTAEPEKSAKAKMSANMNVGEQKAKKGNKSGKADQGLRKNPGKPKGQKKSKKN